MTDVQTLDLDGKGIGGALKGTFLAVIKNWYWYKPASNADNTGELLSDCMDHLGVDRTIAHESSSEPYGAYWDWTNPSPETGRDINGDGVIDFKEMGKRELVDQFSRKRVGDALCEMAIQLSENAADDRDGYIPPQDWTYSDIIQASYGYYGGCEWSGGNYCEAMIARSELFKDLYTDVNCN
jgi:hypothetical protein